MLIARFTEQVVEYLLLSSAMLFLLGMLSLFTVQLFKVKGKTKIWIFVLIFILPVIFPARSFLPESIMIPVQLHSDYFKPLSVISGENPVHAERSIFPITPQTNGKITATGKGISSGSLREVVLYTASMFYKNWKQVAAMLWGVIFSIFFIRIITATHTIKRLLRVSTPVTDQMIMGLLNKCASDTGLTYVPMLYEVQGISTPMAMGFFKPVIIIPSHLITGKSIENLRFALLHELKHIDQRHNQWLFIESLIGAVYFFHPVIHWAKRKIHEEMEHICDGHVIKITHKSATYADYLLNEIWKYSPGRYPAFSLPFVSSASKTADRIRSILENGVASASIPARDIIGMASIFIVFSSFMLFTGATRVQGPVNEPAHISLFEKSDRITAPIQTGRTEHINAFSVTNPLTPPVENKANVIHEAVATQINAEIINKREYVTEKSYQKADTDPVKQATSTTEYTDREKVLQPQGINAEKPESMAVDITDNSLNNSLTADNPITETPEETPPPPAETIAQKYLGTPVKELTIHRIDDIRVLDDYTILLIMRGGAMYLARLKEPRPALLFANYFILDSNTGIISKFDRIKAMSNGEVIGSTGMLGEFYSYKYEGSRVEAIKLLKKNLLKDLVAEGAFKE